MSSQLFFLFPDECMQKSGLPALLAHQQLFTDRSMWGRGDVWDRGLTHARSRMVYSVRDVPPLRPKMPLPSGSQHGMQTQQQLGLEVEEVC